MHRLRMIVAVFACAVGVLGNGVYAHAAGHRIAAPRKTASDQEMQAGLAALQAASGALQGGNAGQISADLQSAISAMQQARPIYRGYREKSIHAASAALKVLQRNGKHAAQHVATLLGRAIQDAQAALSTN